MIFSTEGIVLRIVKYGDTSIVATIYTQQFGLQTYLINGIRTSGKKSKIHLYQPASILDMEIYHNSLKNLQRIKEARWQTVYESIFTDVIKNSIALFMAELLQKSILDEEQNEVMFGFIKENLLFLDKAKPAMAANLPVLFMLQLSSLLGFGMENNYSEAQPFFSLKEGKFTGNKTEVQTELSQPLNLLLSTVLQSIRTQTTITLNGSSRRELLHLTEKYYQYHIADFSELRSLKILEMVIS